MACSVEYQARKSNCLGNRKLCSLRFAFNLLYMNHFTNFEKHGSTDIGLQFINISTLPGLSIEGNFCYFHFFRKYSKASTVHEFIPCRIFLNVTAVLNLTGLCDITCFVKEATCFTVVSFHWGATFFLHFMPHSQSFILLFTHPRHYYFKVNYKSNYLQL